jgi:hypothetical protein
MASSERTGLTEGHNAHSTPVSRIEALDTSVFAIQPGQYSDRTSFLRVQRLLRALQPGYSYLEVGSDLGGSLLPHLLDPACRVAVSVDPRPESQPDERGSDFHYVGNSTARMLAELGKHANAEALGKLITLDTDAAGIDRTAITARPHLALIDAEHTNVAAFSDLLSVLPLVADDAMLTFHDANLVGDTIQIIERFLTHMRTPYSMVILPSCVVLFGFGAFLKPVQTELAPLAEDSPSYFARPAATPGSSGRRRHSADRWTVGSRHCGTRSLGCRRRAAGRQCNHICGGFARSPGRLHQLNIVASDRPITCGSTAGAPTPRALTPPPSQSSAGGCPAKHRGGRIAVHEIEADAATADQRHRIEIVAAAGVTTQRQRGTMMDLDAANHRLELAHIDGREEPRCGKSVHLFAADRLSRGTQMLDP